MRFSKNTYRRLVLALSLAILLVSPGSIKSLSAAALPGNGGYFKVGIGYSPYARTALDLTDISETSSGLAPSIVFGLVWGRQNSLDIRWQSIQLNDFGKNSQGYLAVTYTRYLRKRGPAPFFDLGFGMQHGPFLGFSNESSFLDSNGGIGFTFGAGLRFSRKLEAAVDFGFGSTGRFFSANNNFDFSHQQLAFSLRYTLFGG